MCVKDMLLLYFMAELCSTLMKQLVINPGLRMDNLIKYLNQLTDPN